VLRAGPFSDERVIRLINRRFVPIYFDLSLGGAVPDRDARIFVAKAKPELMEGSVDTPPILVATAAGEVLAEIDNYSSEQQVLDGLRGVLAAHGGWNQVAPDEQQVSKSGTVIEKAALLFDLGRGEAARRLLSGQTGDEAAIALAHLDRLDGDWDAMATALERVKEKRTSDEFVIERAWLDLARGELTGIPAALESVARDSAWSTEARYLAALSLWKADRKAEALAAWRTMIEQSPPDRWVYRADWAFTFVKQGSESGEFSSVGARLSPLGRIGYGGRRPPDLESTAVTKASGSN